MDAIQAFIRGNTLEAGTIFLTGASLFCLLLVFVTSIGARRRQDYLSSIERDRVQILREKSAIWRLFEPWALEWGRLAPSDETTRMTKLQLALDALPGGLPWKAREFLGAKMVESFLVGLAFFAVCWAFIGFPIGVLAGAASGLFLYWSGSKSPLEKLQASHKDFVRRLPFAVDLLALMIDAGALVDQSLRALVREEKGHAIAVHFGKVFDQINLGEPLRGAMQNLANSMDQEDVHEFVFAVIKGDELGTPISEILRNQSDQMKLKRSQRAEKAAANAQIAMTGPGFVIMLVCMAIMAGPFLMNLLPLMMGGATDGGLFSQ